MYVGAIDIGGTKIAVGLVNEEGHIISKEIMPTSPEKGLSYSINRITQSLRGLQESTGASIAGIGISCTGPIDPINGELGINAFLPGWEGMRLVESLVENFHLSIAMENDADAAALAECRWGSGNNSESFLYLTVSTGIGSGLILNNRLYRGVNGAHPEMGHHTVDLNGPQCFCGAKGCWEVMASGPAMTKWYLSQLPNNVKLPNDIDAYKICELARANDFIAKRTIDREANYLGIGLANLITLFTPGYISLGGGVMKSWDLFEEKVRNVIKSTCGLVPFEQTKISLSSLGTDVNLLGAGQTWFHRFSK